MPFNINSSGEVTWPVLLSRAVLLTILLFFTSTLLFSVHPWIFLDGVNLLIHESGHLVFLWGGETLSILGGTLMQLIIPSLFLIYFVKKRELFSGGFCLFWIGENLINISVYIKDAGNMLLPLVGGGEHDWNILLSKWHLLENDQMIGGTVRFFGITVILISLLILSLILFFGVSKKLRAGK